MQNQELRAFVDEILKEKDMTGVDPALVEKMADSLVKRLEAQLHRALLDAMTDEQLTEFDKIVETDDPKAIGEFFVANNIPVQEISATTAMRFKVAYLGV